MQGWLCIGAPIVPLHSVMQIYFFHVHIDHFEKKTHKQKLSNQETKTKQNKTKQNKTKQNKTKKPKKLKQNKNRTLQSVECLHLDINFPPLKARV